ncbi:MAG: hypothetical protein IPL71_09600 [Anaerolineales bacterium]|uniref:magnesium transporter MgtE N-terminal domain-containing protein n=1 Tax=Candidatus Villigracilis proximus TaxID=3140683 RepID=UPI0031359A2B|nr:hypothetical protein [Anaerolineales bacterium]
MAIDLDFRVNIDNLFSIQALWQSIFSDDQRLINFAVAKKDGVLFESGFQERWKTIDVQLQYFVWLTLTAKEQRKFILALNADQQRQILLDISTAEREELFNVMRPQGVLKLISTMTTSEQAKILLSLSETLRN